MQDERPHHEEVMKIAEGNQDAALFFLGMLSVTSSEYFLCRLLETYAALTATADAFVKHAQHDRGGPEDMSSDD